MDIASLGRSTTSALRRVRRPFADPAVEVADGVWLIRGGLARTMNVYLLRNDESGGVVVFDAGEKRMAPAIRDAANALGGITAIVLGHPDTDHRGAAPALADIAPVLCHPDAVACAESPEPPAYWDLTKLPRDVRLLHTFLHRHMWDGGPVAISETLREDDTIAGFRVVDLPGHAPGQIGLWRERDRVALISDCIYLTDMHGKPQAPSAPLDAYNHDTAQARRSILKLAALRPAVVLPGHLGPLRGNDVVDQLHEVARD